MSETITFKDFNFIWQKIFEIVSKCNVWESEDNGNYLPVCL